MIHPAQNRKHRTETQQQRKEGRKENHFSREHSTALTTSPRAPSPSSPISHFPSLTKKTKCPRVTVPAACNPDSSPMNMQGKKEPVPAKKTSYLITEPEDVRQDGCVRRIKEDRTGNPEFPTSHLKLQSHQAIPQACLNDGYSLIKA